MGEKGDQTGVKLGVQHQEGVAPAYVFRGFVKEFGLDAVFAGEPFHS